MRNRLTHPAVRKLPMLFGILFGLLVLDTTIAFGQQASGQPPPNPLRNNNPVGPTDPRWKRPGPNDTDARLRTLRKGSDSSADEEPNSAMAEINQDFYRLEAIRQGYVAPYLTESVHDYKRLCQGASELNNRANHIKFNIPFPLSRDDKKKAALIDDKSEDLALILGELDSRIRSFLNNPMFREARPDEKDLRVAAGRDLEGIIKLSDRANKVAKKLRSKALTQAG